MPSPFPGMDPWLEGPHWMSVHNQLSAEIARQLSRKILPKYVALMAERQVVDDADESVVIRTSDVSPDVAVMERGGDAAAGQTAVLSAPLTLVNPMPRRVPHVSIEIRDVESMQLVTGIEVLSPTNKRGSGYREYLAKRNKILRGTAHILEIDLLREGKRLPLRGGLPPCDDFVFLSRADRRPEAQTWPIRLRGPLPTVPGSAPSGRRRRIPRPAIGSFDDLRSDRLPLRGELSQSATVSSERNGCGVGVRLQAAGFVD